MLTHETAYGADAVAKLGELVAKAKGGDALAPVTIVVRDDIAAISVRRALARGVGGRGGIAAINVTTLRRLAEQLLAAGGDTKPPVTSALLTGLWRGALAADAGCFAPVAAHAATVRALVRAHRELRETDAAALDAIAATGELGADLVRLHRRVTTTALDGRRDDVAVLTDAASFVRRDARIDSFGPVILHLPEEPSPAERAFIEALDDASGLTALVGVTGDVDVDGPLGEVFGGSTADVEPVGATSVFNSSDSDDEVRAVVRDVRALLATGAKAHRIAVLHPVAVPYARLLHDHLAAAGITTNGPGVRPLRDRAIADAFLTLLALDPEDLPRVAVFDWLGRAPIRASGEATDPAPRTRWEKLSRKAGITGGDWSQRLADHEAREQARLDADRDNPDASVGSLAYRERSIAEAQQLSAFIDELRSRLLTPRPGRGSLP